MEVSWQGAQAAPVEGKKAVRLGTGGGRGRQPDGPARLYVRPHDLVLANGDDGFPAQVRALHRLADRITLELAVAGQERALELDLADRADVRVPAAGDDVRVQPLRYRVFGD